MATAVRFMQCVAIEGYETNEILTVRNLRDNQVTAPDSENLLI